MLTAQLADERAKKALADILGPQDEPDFRLAFSAAMAEVGAALRRL